MVARYDIFEKVEHGPIWVEAVEDVERARTLMAELAAVRRSHFLLYDTKRGTFIHEQPPSPL